MSDLVTATALLEFCNIIRSLWQSLATGGKYLPESASFRAFAALTDSDAELRARFILAAREDAVLRTQLRMIADASPASAARDTLQQLIDEINAP